MHSPTALIFPARDTGQPDRAAQLDGLGSPDGRAAPTARQACASIDSHTKEVLDFNAKVVVLAASTLESTRLLLLSKSASRPNGLANSSGAVGHYFCEHVMGPGASGMMPTLRGKAITNDDGRPQSSYVVRFRNIADKHPDFIRGYGLQGGSGSAEYPAHAHTTPGFGPAFKRKVRADHPAPINFTAFGEVLARKENQVELDPVAKDGWGIPVLKFNYRFGDNEMKMAKDMAETAGEMLEAAGAEDIRVRTRRADRGVVDPRAGHGAHGERPEDVGDQLVRPDPRRQEPVRRRRQHLRVGVVPEPDVDDPGAVLARDGLPQGGTADGESGMIDRWRDAKR